MTLQRCRFPRRSGSLNVLPGFRPVLERRTPKGASVLRRLFGKVSLEPVRPMMVGGRNTLRTLRST